MLATGVSPPFLSSTLCSSLIESYKGGGNGVVTFEYDWESEVQKQGKQHGCYGFVMFCFTPNYKVIQGSAVIIHHYHRKHAAKVLIAT